MFYLFAKLLLEVGVDGDLVENPLWVGSAYNYSRNGRPKLTATIADTVSYPAEIVVRIWSMTWSSLN